MRLFNINNLLFRYENGIYRYKMYKVPYLFRLEQIRRGLYQVFPNRFIVKCTSYIFLSIGNSHSICFSYAFGVSRIISHVHLRNQHTHT